MGRRYRLLPRAPNCLGPALAGKKAYTSFYQHTSLLMFDYSVKAVLAKRMIYLGLFLFITCIFPRLTPAGRLTSKLCASARAHKSRDELAYTRKHILAHTQNALS